MITRHIKTVTLGQSLIDVSYRQIDNDSDHYLFILHPSPLSSGFMVPVMQALAEQNLNIIAWDTPGYGDSGSLPERGNGLSGYVEALNCFIRSFTNKPCTIYGNATGAQIAIEYSKFYPQTCEKLVLENVALFTDNERNEFFQEYFPDLSVKADGSHLQKTWQIVNQLFSYFPWYKCDDAHKIDAPKPPMAVIQAAFNDYVKAGADYSLAYRAALENERPEQLQQVSVPTYISLWQDSILKVYSDRLWDVNLPDNINLYKVASGVENRFAALKTFVTATR